MEFSSGVLLLEISAVRYQPAQLQDGEPDGQGDRWVVRRRISRFVFQVLSSGCCMRVPAPLSRSQPEGETHH